MEFIENITINHIICLLGLIILARWLLKSSLGRKALADSTARRNSIPFHVPFIPLFLLSSTGVVSFFESRYGGADSTLISVIAAYAVAYVLMNFLLMLIWVLGWFIELLWCKDALFDSSYTEKLIHPYQPLFLLSIWFLVITLPTSIMKEVWKDLADWQSIFFDNFILCFHEIAAVVVIILIARSRYGFASRLKGFGLNVKTAIKDFFTSFVNLLAVWPVVIALIIITTYIGSFIWGPEYQIQQHQQLRIITLYPHLSIQILVLITAVVVAPLFEEMLFRGLFQTMIRSHIEARGPRLAVQADGHDDKVMKKSGAWPAILIGSMLFAAAHANTGHWPALFVLGIGMGYAYEKSGSLLQPIFIHSLFNATMIVATLSQ